MRHIVWVAGTGAARAGVEEYCKFKHLFLSFILEEVGMIRQVSNQLTEAAVIHESQPLERLSSVSSS